MRSVALACVLAFASIVSTAVPASAVGSADYPSWDEVQAARGDQAATQSAISRIDSLLSGLEADAARLGDAAVARTAEASAAKAALDTATTRATTLAERADSASERATLSTQQAGQIAARLYRSGGNDLTGMLIITGDTDDLLSRLGSLDRLGGRLDLALERAESDRNQATALSSQARVARSARDAASTAAQSALASATSAAQAADAAVASQQAGLTVLYDQLAALKNTTAALEQQYRASQQPVNAPNTGGNTGTGTGTNSGGTDGSGSGSGSSDGGDVAVPGGEVNNVAAARAYAAGRLAAAGQGADQLSCLVQLWNRESGWRTNAYNASSGAYGIPQSLPGSKMAVMGADWRTNYETQINWGLSYISSRYGSPCGAWAHSEDVGWY